MTAGSQPAPAGHPPRRVSVYIDGFNLYYGSLKDTPYKWLDPYALACALMPSDHVDQPSTTSPLGSSRRRETPRSTSDRASTCVHSRPSPTSTYAKGSSCSRTPDSRRCSRSTRRTRRSRTRPTRRSRSG